VVKNLKFIVAVILIFGSGLLTGSMLSRFYWQTPPVANAGNANLGPAWARLEFIRRVQRHLSLSEKQKTNIDLIVTDGQNRLRNLWEPIAPEVQQTLAQIRERVMAELTVEQKARFEELSRQHSSRRPEDTGARNRPRKPEWRPGSIQSNPPAGPAPQRPNHP
jgi:hypothetical protein